jgi:hypothetical protein
MEHLLYLTLQDTHCLIYCTATPNQQANKGMHMTDIIYMAPQQVAECEDQYVVAVSLYGTVLDKSRRPTNSST